MRILYCTDTYPPQVNGVSVVTHLAVGGLIRRGHAVGVVGPRYDRDAPGSVFGSAELLTAIPSWPCPTYPDIRLALPDYFAIAEAAVGFQPDVIHCATEFVIGRLGQMVARRMDLPLVTSYHTDFGRYMSAYGAAWLRRPTTAYLTRFHARADLTLTPSRSAAGQLGRMGVDRTIVWGAGVDAEQFRPERRNPDLRARLGLDGRFTFLHVGRLAPEKNVELVIEAFRHCRRELGPDRVRLVIAGDGPSRDALARTAPPEVVFLGWLDRSETLPELYASADSFVFSSETETLGLVLLEAMASGLPVVAAPEAGVNEYLRHGVNGLAYQAGDAHAMADAMIQLVERPSFRDMLARGARGTAAAQGWERELDRLARIYRNLLERAGRLDAPAARPLYPPRRPFALPQGSPGAQPLRR